jgi:Protein of unknown function (DUF1573)
VFTIMMRWLLLAVLVVALTAMATIGLYFLPTGSAADKGPEFPSSPVAEKAGPPGIAEVDSEPTHDFGTMAQYSIGRKSWMIKNVGKGDLRLVRGTSTCSCTIASLKDGASATLKPGDETSVDLEWNTKENKGSWSQSAEILTPDDPKRQKIEFKVHGKVTPAIITIPPGNSVSFMNIATDEKNIVHFAVFSPDKDDLEITSLTSSRPDLISATVQPLTTLEREEIKVESKSGLRVDVEVKPGMPLGEFHEDLVVKTNHPKQAEFHMAVVGRTVGAISVMPDHVRFSAVSGARAASEVLTLWVRGGEQTKFEVVKSPANLKVEIAGGDDNGKAVDPNAKAKKYRLTVTVPPGTPPSLIDGLIILKTDHPGVTEVRIPVNVTVRNAG